MAPRTRIWVTVVCSIGFALLGGPSSLAAGAANCTDGIVHDNGFEATFSASEAPLVAAMRFEPASPSLLERVCICWQLLDSNPSANQASFDIVVLDDDGPGGEPGTVLGSQRVEASGITAEGSFYNFDVSGLGIPSDGAVFVAIDSMPANGPALCADFDGPGTSPIFVNTSLEDPFWTNLSDLGFPLRAIGIRATFEPQETEPTEPCTPGPTTLCIDDEPGDGRFQVEVDFETVQGGGASGQGQAIPLSSLDVNRGGLFWFFAADNPEMLIKVINACAVNGHYWVFYSATTNVGLNVRVLDTTTGRLFINTNPDQTAAAPVQNVTAFPCDGS